MIGLFSYPKFNFDIKVYIPYFQFFLLEEREIGCFWVQVYFNF